MLDEMQVLRRDQKRTSTGSVSKGLVYYIRRGLLLRSITLSRSRRLISAHLPNEHSRQAYLVE